MFYHVFVQILDSAGKISRLSDIDTDVSVDFQEGGLVLNIDFGDRIWREDRRETVMGLILPVPSFGVSIRITCKTIYWTWKTNSLS